MGLRMRIRVNQRARVEKKSNHTPKTTSKTIIKTIPIIAIELNRETYLITIPITEITPAAKPSHQILDGTAPLCTNITQYAMAPIESNNNPRSTPVFLVHRI